MFRNYENPYTVENKLREVETTYEDRKLAGTLTEEEMFDFEQTIQELKDRVNYAWQDDYE